MGKGRTQLVGFLPVWAAHWLYYSFFGTLFSIFSPDEDQTSTTETIEMDADNQPVEIAYPKHPKFTQIAYYKRDSNGDFNYRVFVYVTDASPKDMEKHAKKQQWSPHGTTMVCYFRSAEGLNSEAITLAKNVDAAINEIWKPNLVARYIHWPTDKVQFEENPYVEDGDTPTSDKKIPLLKKQVHVVLQ